MDNQLDNKMYDTIQDINKGIQNLIRERDQARGLVRELRDILIKIINEQNSDIQVAIKDPFPWELK